MYQKKISMISTLSLYALMFFTCWNGTLTNSSSDSKLPDINFWGTLQDHYESFPVENIEIAGKYEAIPVYQTVHNPNPKDGKIEVDPRQNKTLLDLKEIKSISLKHPDHPVAGELDVQGRKYIEVIVTLINGSSKEYLIESNRTVSCTKKDKGPDGAQTVIGEEKKLAMLHVRSLTIEGHQSNIKEKQDQKKDDKEKESDASEKALNKKIVANETGSLISDIEKQVRELPKDDPSKLEVVKQSLLGMLKSLRAQLQKILNMLQ